MITDIFLRRVRRLLPGVSIFAYADDAGLVVQDVAKTPPVSILVTDGGARVPSIFALHGGSASLD